MGGISEVNDERGQGTEAAQHQSRKHTFLQDRDEIQTHETDRHFLVVCLFCVRVKASVWALMPMESRRSITCREDCIHVVLWPSPVFRPIEGGGWSAEFGCFVIV